jgi:hypothetical protein
LSWLRFGEVPPVLREGIFGRGERISFGNRERERERERERGSEEEGRKEGREEVVGVWFLVVSGWQQHPNSCVKICVCKNRAACRSVGRSVGRKICVHVCSDVYEN